MSVVGRGLAAAWDFVVGDDPRLALAALAALGLTALACAVGLDAWWAAPLVALCALRWSLRGATGPAASGARSPTARSRSHRSRSSS